MNIVFHPEAEAEFFEAIEYYEAVEKGLGFDFSQEILSTIQNIVDYPHAWPMLYGDIRRCLTNRFPFGVIYDFEEGRLHILAIMHLRRKPDYWQTRC